VVRGQLPTRERFVQLAFAIGPGDVTGQGSHTFGAGWDTLRSWSQKVETGGQ
jgi:hypothetical protein